jgi:hypothetical protein
MLHRCYKATKDKYQMKKRYSVTLTEESVREFKTRAKSLGLPHSMLSTVCNKGVAQYLMILRLAQSKGNVTLSDVFAMVDGELTLPADTDQERTNVE